MQTGDILHSRYKLIRPLQTSWMALDQMSHQECLLKPFSSFSDPQVAVWLGQVRHAGLPRLLGQVQAPDGEVYWIFEFIGGQTFAELASCSGGQMTLPQLLPLAIQAARILAFIHDQDEQQILHLDIKPENLLLSSQGIVSLIDFGAARLINLSSIQAEHVESGRKIALTVEYAAPELLQGYLAASSDIYAFGLTILQLLSGQPPENCRSKPLPEIFSAIPDLSDHLKRLLGQCLHTDPGQRPGSAVELACALASGLALPEPSPRLPANSEPDADAVSPVQRAPSQTPASLICIWDGPDFGCELAAILSEGMSVLVIDADLLNPQADLLLGIESGLHHVPGRTLAARQSPGGLDQVLAEEQRGRLDVSLLNQLARPSQIRQVRVLSSLCGLDQYECFQLDTFYAVLQRARLIHDAVIILCSQFVFDAFTCLCLQIADLVLMPVNGDNGAFRKSNRAVEFLAARQQINLDKLKYIAFPYDSRLDLSKGTMNELCCGRLLGSISDCPARRRMKSGATPYAAAINQSNRHEYRTMISKMNLNLVRPAQEKEVTA